MHSPKRKLISGLFTGVVVFLLAAPSAPAEPGSARDPRSSAGSTTGVIVRAAGDVACDPKSPAFSGSDSKKCQQRATASLLKGANVVFAIGDTQYECGGARAYKRSYDFSWGLYKRKTFAVPGDQEYGTRADTPGGTDCSVTPDAAGYFGYFGNRGGSTTDPTLPGVTQSPLPGVYSLNFPRGCTPGEGGTCTWHVIALNVCSAVGGCGTGDPMEVWLKGDLAANAWARCSLVLMHKPRFASGAKATGTRRPDDQYEILWQDFVASGVDMVLSGNSHFYERFAPQDADGHYDPNGTVQWVVGTGGKSHGEIADPQHRLPNSAIGQDRVFGVLQLILKPDSYGWRFLPVQGAIFKDRGMSYCS